MSEQYLRARKILEARNYAQVAYVPGPNDSRLYFFSGPRGTVIVQDFAEDGVVLYADWLCGGLRWTDILPALDRPAHPYYEMGRIKEGDCVMAIPKGGDFAHQFFGAVTGFRNGHVQVTDQDGAVFECDPDQLTLEHS